MTPKAITASGRMIARNAACRFWKRSDANTPPPAPHAGESRSWSPSRGPASMMRTRCVIQPLRNRPVHRRPPPGLREWATTLTGCTDQVIFITKTSVGIDADTTLAAVSIAYDRTDGYLGPRYEDGSIPPVVSSICKAEERERVGRVLKAGLRFLSMLIHAALFAWVVASQGLLSEALE